MILLAVVAVVVVILSFWYSANRPGVAMDILQGAPPDAVFRHYCSPCHGPDGSGTDIGPRLRGRNLDRDYVRRMILSGTLKMPPIRNMHEPMLTQVAQFVKELP